jgi:uncharacterized protein
MTRRSAHSPASNRTDPMRTLALIVSCLALGATLAHADAPPPVDPNKTVPVQITWDQKIPMRDGVRLSATIYRDPAQTKPLPVILTMTPYIAAHAAKQGNYFAHNGYVFVAVDSRGRGNSEGTFVPSRVEGKDGYDAVEWAARQPWCDGQVAMWGGSWLGFTQWSVAKEFPPHLKAIAPTASVHPGTDFPVSRGIVQYYALQWLSYVYGRALNDGIFETQDLWNNAEWQQISTGRSFTDFEEIAGIRGTVFRTWVAHPVEDTYWQAATPRAADYAKIRIPILTITGHFDGDQLGALTYYDRHLANAPAEVTARHWLVIGPWDHGGTRRPKAEIGGLQFGPAALMSMEELHKAWYDHVLKGAPAPAFLKDRVACFVMGRNEWHYAHELKQLEGGTRSFPLDLTGAVPGDVLRSGVLAAQLPATPASVTLISDPRYLPPRESLDAEFPDYYKDQRGDYEALGSHVVLHTAPIPAEIIVAGRAQLHLQMAVDQPDADLRAYLSEIRADGSAILLARTRVRLRYRKAGTRAVFMIPGTPEVVDVPPFQFTARSLAKGSRLRLVVDVAPQFGRQRNTNTGGDLATEPLSKARVAKITLMTGPTSGSVLELPQPEPGLIPPAKPN